MNDILSIKRRLIHKLFVISDISFQSQGYYLNNDYHSKFWQANREFKKALNV